MIEALGRLPLRDWLIVAAGLGLVAGLEVTKPGARGNGPLSFPREAVVRDLVAQARDEVQEQNFRTEFATRDYFGAFAIAPDGSHAWSYGYGTMAAAEQGALSRCATVAENCRVTSILVPRVWNGEEDTLSWQQAQLLAEVAAQSGPRAVAVSADGARAAGHGPFAERDALSGCDRARQTGSGLPEHRCRIVGLWSE
ncbi:MAG: hypothetical protein ACK4KW_01225 [Gemmobacter sp.]